MYSVLGETKGGYQEDRKLSSKKDAGETHFGRTREKFRSKTETQERKDSWEVWAASLADATTSADHKGAFS